MEEGAAEREEREGVAREEQEKEGEEGREEKGRGKGEGGEQNKLKRREGLLTIKLKR